MLCVGIVYGRDLSRAWLMNGWMKLGAVALLSWRWLALLTMGVAAGMAAAAAVEVALARWPVELDMAMVAGA